MATVESNQEQLRAAAQHEAHLAAQLRGTSSSDVVEYIRLNQNGPAPAGNRTPDLTQRTDEVFSGL